MPVKRRIPKVRGRLTLPERWALVCGEADGHEVFETEAERREAWERHRADVMAGINPGKRPRAWWEYDSSVPRDENLEQHVQLFQMGELREDELAQLRAWGWLP